MLNRANPKVLQIVATQIAPRAAKIDREGAYPEVVLRSLGRSGAFSHHVGEGRDLSAAVTDLAQVSAACLTTGFCMWCQNALALYLDRSPNVALSQRLTQTVSQAEILGGTGLSNPMKFFSDIEPLALHGERLRDGYKVTGKLPWVSNVLDGHFFGIIFSVSGRPPVMAVVCADDDKIKLYDSSDFVGLNGTATQTVVIRNLFIPDGDVIAEDVTKFIPLIRQSFVGLQLGMAFGLVQGILATMKADQKGLAQSQYYEMGVEPLTKRLALLQEDFSRHLPHMDDGSKSAFLEILRLRYQASMLVLDSSRSEMIQAGARGYLSHSTVNRHQREAQFVAIVTPSVKHIMKELRL